MSIKLSHSAAEKYKNCPAQYKLHYIERIRSHQIGSALLFGSALDETLNVLLETKLDKPTERATDDLERLYNGFDYHLTYQMINKEQEDVRTSHFVEYFKSDFDPDLLLKEDIKSLETFIQTAGYFNEEEQKVPEPLELYEEVKELLNSPELSGADLSYYNYCNWLSLRRKGHLMIKHYKEEIMPKIKRVESVQKKIELVNDDGDGFTGYSDFEAEVEGYDGVITLDNKTSSRKYKLEDVNDKGQLLKYDEFTENGIAGYVVLLKKVKYTTNLKCDTCGKESTRRLKNCPEKKCKGKMEQVSKIPKIESQILIDEIDDDKKDLTFDELSDIIESIEKEEFPQNRDSCFQFGRRCIYYSLCRSNPMDPDYEGLAKV